jgi:hypothetical protein
MNKHIYEMTGRAQPGVPPGLPGSRAETTGSKSVPSPNVYEEPAGPTEYYVLTLNSPKAMELEEKLNDAGHDGWQLFQIIQQGEQLLLVFVRRLERRL